MLCQPALGQVRILTALGRTNLRCRDRAVRGLTLTHQCLKFLQLLHQIFERYSFSITLKFLQLLHHILERSIPFFF